jgi:hypothetical protein
VVVSSTAPQTAGTATTGDTLARTALDVEDFSLTITNTLTPVGHSNSILAMKDMEISDVAVELSLTVSDPNTTINSDFFNRTARVRCYWVWSLSVMVSAPRSCCLRLTSPLTPRSTM